MATEFFSSLEQGSDALMSFMFSLEKLDRDTMMDFLLAARLDCASRLRAQSDSLQKRLVQAEQVLVRAGDMFELNVNNGQIAGLICASLLEFEN